MYNCFYPGEIVQKLREKNRNKIVEQYRFNGFITAFIKDASVCYSEHEQKH